MSDGSQKTELMSEPTMYARKMNLKAILHNRLFDDCCFKCKFKKRKYNKYHNCFPNDAFSNFSGFRMMLLSSLSSGKSATKRLADAASCNCKIACQKANGKNENVLTNSTPTPLNSSGSSFAGIIDTKGQIWIKRTTLNKNRMTKKNEKKIHLLCFIGFFFQNKITASNSNNVIRKIDLNSEKKNLRSRAWKFFWFKFKQINRIRWFQHNCWCSLRHLKNCVMFSARRRPNR